MDTVSNDDAWFNWWARNKDSNFEAPRFSLTHNVIVDSMYIVDLSFEDHETNNVPQKWLEDMKKYIETRYGRKPHFFSSNGVNFMKLLFVATFLFSSIIIFLFQGQKNERQYDPVTMDPVTGDTNFPASMIPFVINSSGSHLNAIIYLSQGSGPHPTVVLLHGFPGNEKNLDLAQAIRRAGWNVVFFHYRGAWGSQGNFSLDHCKEDVASALTFLRDAANAKKFRVDARKIVLVGHSMGGFMALRTIVDDSHLLGAVWIAGGNISEFGRWARESAENKDLYEKYVRDSSAPLNGIDVEQLVMDVIDHPMSWDLRTHAEILSKRKLLMIGATNDDEVALGMHYAPLVDSLGAFNPQHLSTIVIDTDHSFSNKRIELARCIISWLNQLVRRG